MSQSAPATNFEGAPPNGPFRVERCPVGHPLARCAPLEEGDLADLDALRVGWQLGDPDQVEAVVLARGGEPEALVFAPDDPAAESLPARVDALGQAAGGAEDLRP